MRYEYIKRLIKGVRGEIEDVMKDSEARKEFPDVVRSDWLDASILCDVIEQDIEFTQFANIEENIVAVEYSMEHSPDDEHTNLLMEVIDVLRSLKPRCETEVQDIEYGKIKYVLEGLRSHATDKSNYATAIIDWFGLDNSFFVNACVFKDMEESLILYIMKPEKPQIKPPKES